MLRELSEMAKTRLTDLAETNPTTILTGLGVSGVVSTAYLTGRASFKSAQLIKREEEKLHFDPKLDRQTLDSKERIKLVWPLYIPPVTMGASTITCIVMSNHVASKKVAALAVASGISERALQEYKAKVVERLGESKEMTIRDEIAQDRVNNNPPSREVILAGTGDVLCFDMMTGRYFQSSVEKIRQAENKINFEILNHMYASLSSFYDEIDLPPTAFSDEVGWNGNELFEVQFSTVLSPDNRPCVAIDFARAPFAEYSRTW